MGTIGFWVSARIEEAASENAAAVAALQVDAVVGPLVQSLRRDGNLDPGTRALLDQRLSRGVMSEELFAFKIWKPDGEILYASDSSQIGLRFPVTTGLAVALAGGVHTEFDSLDEGENERERQVGVPFLEIYSPIRDAATGDVIAVVEFYDEATGLGRELQQARSQTWLVVGAATGLMLSMLGIVVARGGRVIDSQRRALREKVATLSELLAQNSELGERAKAASRNAASINERFLRRFSADIHDGPLQLLGYASLRLSSSRAPTAADRRRIAEAVETATTDLRSISRGLAIPELEGTRPAEAVRRAVRGHRLRDDTPIETDLDEDIAPLPPAETICVYRFVQEGLANAARHAHGRDVKVTLASERGDTVVRIVDRGPGFDASRPADGLGLPGLRERVAALGGTWRSLRVATERPSLSGWVGARRLDDELPNPGCRRSSDLSGGAGPQSRRTARFRGVRRGVGRRRGCKTGRQPEARPHPPRPVHAGGGLSALDQIGAPIPTRGSSS